jgi:hypothetical protein
MRVVKETPQVFILRGFEGLRDGNTRRSPLDRSKGLKNTTEIQLNVHFVFRDFLGFFWWCS